MHSGSLVFPAAAALVQPVQADLNQDLPGEVQWPVGNWEVKADDHKD